MDLYGMRNCNLFYYENLLENVLQLTKNEVHLANQSQSQPT